MSVDAGDIGADLDIPVGHILQEPEILAFSGYFEEIGGSKAAISHRRHRIRHLHSVHIPEMIMESRGNSGYSLREITLLISLQPDSVPSHTSSHAGHFHSLRRRRTHGKCHIFVVFQSYTADIIFILQRNFSVFLLHVSCSVYCIKK